MKVKDIIWIDKDSHEAEVLVSDGVHHCHAFCHPCHLKVGDEILEPLHSLGEASVYRVDHQEVTIRQQPGSDCWQHELVAVVLDRDTKLVQVGQIRVVLSTMPGDIANGETIECFPDRLDIYD